MNSYSDPSASTANTNPIVLNSGGNPPQEIWIASTATFVLAPANDTDPPSSPYRTWNDLPGINNVAALIASTATGEWVQGSTVTFVGVTAFSLVGDQTALYTLGRRIKAAVTGGDRFGIVTSAVVSGGSTSVGVTLDSSTLNGGLSSVQYGLLSTPNGSLPWAIESSTGISLLGPLTFLSVAQNESQTTVSSSPSPNIWSGGDIINYTGTTNATTFSNAPQTGTRRILITDSTSIFSSSAALTILGISGASSYTAFAGDRLEVLATSTNTFNLYGNLYRKGTWIPTVSGTSTTYVIQSGNYIKIGEFIYITGTLHVSTIGNGSSTNIAGLPFPSVINAAVSVGNVTSAATSVVSVEGYIGAGSASIFLLSRLAATSTDAQNNLIGNNTALRFAGCYISSV